MLVALGIFHPLSTTFMYFQLISILEQENKTKLRYVHDLQNIFKRGCIDVLEFTKPLPVGHPMCWADSMYLIIRNEKTFTKNLFLQQQKIPSDFLHIFSIGLASRFNIFNGDWMTLSRFYICLQGSTLCKRLTFNVFATTVLPDLMAAFTTADDLPGKGMKL